ncbi:unnamed protein product [Ostreobium quekettii]|uniref:phosphoribosylglycinamide formyltransferase 1 n=1 Tax=Ostreobium quekettii TaxID=121088 RepID=A0A8S1IME0_9CHLO|nr:unnamed protein product [Ostreobium quekettii]
MFTSVLQQKSLCPNILQHQGWALQRIQWQLLGSEPRTQMAIRTFTASTAAMVDDGSAGGCKSRLAMFVSGAGSNFKSIHAACSKGKISAEVVLVVSNVPKCGGMQYAREQDIPTLLYPSSKKLGIEGVHPDVLLTALRDQFRVDYILLGGYLRLIPPEVVRAYRRRILNIHPALLPSFGGAGFFGMHVHEAVVASGVRLSGPTVHFVDEDFDRGPILAQRVVPVYPSDAPEDVQGRVLEQEHLVYPACVAALCEGRISWREDGVPIMWEDGNQL